MLAREFSKFNILDFQSQLTPAKGKNRYICPVCENDNLTIDPATGAYQCWNGCECKDVRNAIAPLERKQLRPKQDRTWTYTSLTGEFLIRTRRVDDGEGNRRIWQEYQVNGQWVSGSKAPKDIKQAAKKAVVPYRYLEALQAVQNGAERVFVVEGEPCADACWKLNIPAITPIGGSNSYRNYGDYAALLKDFPAEIIICPDRDQTGLSYAAEVAIDLGIKRWCKSDPENQQWQNPPQKGGLDIADWISDGATAEQIMAAIAPMAPLAAKPLAPEQPEEPEDERIAFGNFCQRALSSLYTLNDPDRPWVCVSGQFYQWQGTHYEASPDEVEYRRVFQYADNFKTISKEGVPKYPFAAPHHVEQAIKWIKMGLAVDPRRVNPAGLNCTNGILTVHWRGDRPSVQLQPHSPEVIFTYAPVVKYDPNANPEACDRMLSALELGQRDVFLKVAAASLDLPSVRKFRGRLVRALLMKGDGSNGKDTLRESLSAIYGYQGVTGCSLSDFEAYDQGRKFSLARLKDARVNWASENGNATKLDRLQSLKAFITGDTLDCERKGENVEEFTPRAIGVFNINDVPHLEAFQEAIKSRYAVVSFDKTFKVGADISRGELEADPRLKYDHDFLRQQVLPAFLNKLVDALQRLMIEGIDYSCTEAALTEIQRSSSHLFQFSEDVGLTYGQPGDRLYAGEIWQHLKAWYLANGTLTIETTDRGKEKLVWVEQSRSSDRNIKAPNQVVPRILQLFPKARRGTDPDPKGVYITGVALKQLIQFEPKPDPVTQSERDFEAVDPILPIAAQVEQLISKLSEDERQLLFSQLGVEQIGSTAQNSDQQSDTGSEIGSKLVQTASETDGAIDLPKTPHARDGDNWKTEDDPFWEKYFPQPPHGTSRKDRALGVRQALLNASTKSELTAVKRNASIWTKPVWNRVLTVLEQQQIVERSRK